MSEKLDIGEARKNDAKLEALKNRARERIESVIEKFRDDPNLVINIEDENSETITLEIRVIDENGKDSKIYHKGFLKILNMPNGLSIEEEVERQIRFPEEALKNMNLGV